jgi:hypothetical protein
MRRTTYDHLVNAMPERDRGHDVGVSFVAPVSASIEVVEWFRGEATSTLAAVMVLNKDESEVNPFDDWKEAPIKLWRVNVGMDGRVRLGAPAPIEKVRWSTVRSGVLSGVLAEVFAAPTFRIPVGPGGSPPMTATGPLRLSLYRIGFSALRYDPPHPLPPDDGFWIDLSLDSTRFDRPKADAAALIHGALDRAMTTIGDLTSVTSNGG